MQVIFLMNYKKNLELIMNINNLVLVQVLKNYIMIVKFQNIKQNMENFQVHLLNHLVYLLIIIVLSHNNRQISKLVAQMNISILVVSKLVNKVQIIQ